MKLSYWTGSPLLGATRKCLVHCLRMQQCCAESASKHQRCFIVIKYCSQACSVAAKATAFCICIFILKFWLDCPYFSSDFGGVSALPLGFTCEVLVASSSMPSANREWYLLGPYNVQSLVSFYPDLPHWHPSPVTEKNQMCECRWSDKVLKGRLLRSSKPQKLPTVHYPNKTEWKWVDIDFSCTFYILSHPSSCYPLYHNII